MKIIIFDNDEAFEQFALKPDYVLRTSAKSDMTYYDIEFSDEYLDAIKGDTHFYFSDRNSKVRKRGVVQRGVLSKRVENIINACYRDIEILRKLYPPQRAEIINYGE